MNQYPHFTKKERYHIDQCVKSGMNVSETKPLRQLAIGPRNRESLRRLAYLAEGRPEGPT